MQIILNRQSYSQSGFTLIELMIVIAIIGVLTAIATLSYQNQVRKAHIMTIYQTLSQYQIRYQTLMDEGGTITNFSTSDLNMPTQTKYCQFSVNAPNLGYSTPNAIVCQVQNLNYLTNQTLSLNLNVDSSWSCQASSGIAREYLPQACQ
ncbi:pilin [Psychrobacter glacincola]|uniref:pilin n=1 Tax=Psychrobacter glacincola TaxID=56810 RepID=UPI003FD0D89F